MKIHAIVIFFHICCYTFSHQSCFEDGKDYLGFDIYQNLSWTKDADQCQKLCQDTDSCEYWTYMYEYDYHKYLCHMKYSKERAVLNREAISGPKYCTKTPSITSITTTTTISTTTSSCFQWGIQYLDSRSWYYVLVKSPEECQWYCNIYKCKYWTWFLDQDPNCQGLMEAGRCNLIENYPEEITGNRCAVSGPKNCSDVQPTTSSTTTTISTTHSNTTPSTPSHDDDGSNAIIIWMLIGSPISLVICGILNVIFKRKWKQLRAQEESNIMTQNYFRTTNNGISVISSQQRQPPQSVQNSWSFDQYQNLQREYRGLHRSIVPQNTVPSSLPLDDSPPKNVYDPPSYEQAMASYDNDAIAN